LIEVIKRRFRECIGDPTIVAMLLRDVFFFVVVWDLTQLTTDGKPGGLPRLIGPRFPQHLNVRPMRTEGMGFVNFDRVLLRDFP
jgi:hypothetical protein